MTIRIFLSYSHKDRGHLDRLDSHLAPLFREKDIRPWFDGDIEPGKAITPEIRKALRETDIFVGLGSADYLRSDYCYKKEYRPMLRKAKQGRVRVVVALVGICDWPNTEMAAYKMLPNDARSVEEHGLRNRAYNEIAGGIRRIVRAVRQEKGKARTEAERRTSGNQKAASGKSGQKGGSSQAKRDRSASAAKGRRTRPASTPRQAANSSPKPPAKKPAPAPPAVRRNSTASAAKARKLPKP